MRPKTLSDCKQDPKEQSKYVLVGGDLAQIPEDELAAGLAAVIAHIKSQEEQLSFGKSQPKESGWLLAARQEGVGAANVRCAMDVKGGATLWRLWRSLGIVILMVIFGSLPAVADPLVNPQYLDSPVDGLLKQGDRRLLKVALAVRQNRCVVSLADGGIIADASSGRRLLNVDRPSEWTVQLSSKDNDRRLTLTPKLAPNPALASNPSPNPNPNPYKDVSYFPSVPSEKQMRLTPSVSLSIPAELLQNASLPAKAKQADPANPVYPSVNVGSGFLVVPSRQSLNESEHLVSYNGKLYRGILWIRPCFERTDQNHSQLYFQVINLVDVEDYLLSVLPSEMPSSWPEEALKAQAIAARSYALANLSKYRQRDFDLKDTIDDQVYTGVQAEVEATNRAVANTNGIVIMHSGKVASAFFHSSSGGHTELAEHVWGRPVPFLKAVPDYDHQSPHSDWQRRIAVEDLPGALGFDVAACVGKVLAMMPIVRTPSSRLKELLVVGDRGARIVSADALRRSVKLPSTNFNVTCEEGVYCFSGSGFGHGLGMSQWGARALADVGYNAAQILSYYYKDVTLEYSADTPGI